MSTSTETQANGAAAANPPQSRITIGNLTTAPAPSGADAPPRTDEQPLGTDKPRKAEAPNAAAVQAVQAAIVTAGSGKSEVAFGAFKAMMVPSAVFTDIYSEDGKKVSFYRYDGKGPAGFRPLGDIASLDKASGVLFFAVGSDASVFASPVGFQKILGSGDSGARERTGERGADDVTYWTPLAPDGYVAVGICFTNGETPVAGNYWCVKQSYVQEVSQKSVWRDTQTTWSSKGDLMAPCFTAGQPEIAPTAGILVLPPTLLSLSAGIPGYALVGTQATLAVTAIPAPKPVYVQGLTVEGDVTACGLGSTVVVVPFTAVTVDAEQSLKQAMDSPFYYVASEPFWSCKCVQSGPGGTAAVNETVGVRPADAAEFAKATSMTVGARFGAAYGGVSAGVSVSMTEALGLKTSQSGKDGPEVTVPAALNLPEQKTTSVWQKQTQIQVFRSDGTVLGTVSYQNGFDDVRMQPSGITPARLALQRSLPQS